MSKGLGKLEQWILITCYHKQIAKLQLMDFTSSFLISAQWYRKKAEEAREEKIEREKRGEVEDFYYRRASEEALLENAKREEEDYFSGLTQYEILVNYFELPFTLWWERYIKIKTSPKRRAAQASLSRAKKRLKEKGLIDKDHWCFTLTDAGIDKAEELLKNAGTP